MKKISFIFAAISLVTFSSARAEFCRNISAAGFSVEGQGQGSDTYSCPAPTPYFSTLNFTVGQGLRCNGYPTTFSGTLSCDNHSKQSRDVRNVWITCCDTQQY